MHANARPKPLIMAARLAFRQPAPAPSGHHRGRHHGSAHASRLSVPLAPKRWEGGEGEGGGYAAEPDERGDKPKGDETAAAAAAGAEGAEGKLPQSKLEELF